MKYISILAALLLAGCASHEKVSYTAPSVVAVKTGIERLRPLVKPEGLREINDLSKAVDTYQAQVDQQSIDLAKAQNDAVYWNAKQVKALKELWTWRLIALSAILCVVLYIGIRTAWKFTL